MLEFWLLFIQEGFRSGLEIIERKCHVVQLLLDSHARI